MATKVHKTKTGLKNRPDPVSRFSR
uniref:Uncharacterized protein n=1 Tax=Arundo donax TaxID=35708 RepID=A0A0A9HJI2_ARUDO